MDVAAEATWIKCPQCSANVPSYDGFVTWCDQCGWNVQPQPAQPVGRLARLNESLGKRQSLALFNEVMADNRPKSRLTLTFVLAVLIAALVYSVTIAFVILAGWLISRAWPDIISLNFFVALFFLALAWYLRPNFGKLPAGVLPKSDYPTLYRLVDEVADSLNAPRIDAIVIDRQFGASTGRVGLRQQRVLYLGLPLWSILTNQEKVAILSHELAHHVNHDPTRSFFIANAISTLARWHWLLTPTNTARMIQYNRPGFVAYVSEFFANLIMKVLSVFPWLASHGLAYLLLREQQRAEYRADHLAATVSGTAAILSLMDKSQFERTFAILVQKVSLYHKDKNLFVELRQRITEVPQRELERIKRLSEVEMSRLDVTHPPTIYRINFLSRQPQMGKPEILSPSEFDQIEQETAALQPTIQQHIVKAYHAGLIAR